jgi:hypothetical protein
MAAEGMTPRQPPGTQPHAAQRPVKLNCLSRVIRTRRVKPARAGKMRRNQQLIRLEQREDGAGRGAAARKWTSVHGFHV